MRFLLRSWKLGRAFGIPLFVHPSWLLAPALVVVPTFSAGLGVQFFFVLLVVSLFACVLLHELGHALMARRFGIRTRDITLYPIGGVARLERMSEVPHEELLIALAGPAVNFAIVLLLLPLVWLLVLLGGAHPGVPFDSAGFLGTMTQYLVSLGVTNLMLGLFNLLPVFPMDGGRVLRALLAMGFGLLRATEIAALIGLVLGVGLGIVAILFRQPILLAVTLFLVFAGQQELRALRRREIARRAAEVPEAPPSVPAQPSFGYTGLTFDQDRRLWVWWQDGRPVAAHWNYPE
jgi:Zn-dependent protease